MGLVLGNKAHGSTNPSVTQAVTLSYAAGSVLVVDVGANSAPVVSVVSAALGNLTLWSTTGGGQSGERWYYKNTTAQTSDTITVTQSGSNFISVDAYEWQGADTTSPFDPAGPLVFTGFPSDPNSLTTTKANTAPIGFFRQNSQSTPTAGSGFSTISGADFQLVEYKILSSTATVSFTETTGLHDTLSLLADAIVQASGTSAASETRPTPSFGPGNGPASGRRVLQAFPPPVDVPDTKQIATFPKGLFRPGAGPGRGLVPTRAFPITLDMAAGTGTFVETGVAATFDTALVASFGSFVLTGIDAQFVGGMPQVGTPVDFLFGPGRGPMRGLKATQAFPDTVSTSVTLTAAAGVFVETGQPASFDTALTAAFGSFALTGIDAQFVGGMPQVGRSADLLFAPGGGPTRGLRPTTAFPDTVPASIMLTAGTGIYTETGEPVTFDTGLAAAFGSFAETGQAITADIALNAAPGIFVLTGIAATLVPTGQPVGVTGGGGARHFTRQRWRELQELIAAEEAAEAKARGDERPHLAEAAAQAREAIEALEQVEAREAVAADVCKLTRTLQGAMGAKSLRASIAQATAANAMAKAMLARIVEMELDEEESVMFLLLS